MRGGEGVWGGREAGCLVIEVTEGGREVGWGEGGYIWCAALLARRY